ncbi:MAG: hypothetical protein ACI9BO_000810 [Zhongshania sp.]|jgi:hypothetical protein
MDPVSGSSVNPISKLSLRPVAPVELASSLSSRVANVTPAETSLPRPVKAPEFEEAPLNLVKPSKTAESIYAEQGVSPAKLAILSAKPVLVAEAKPSPEGVIFTVDVGGRAVQAQGDAAKPTGIASLEDDVSPNGDGTSAESAEKTANSAQSRQEEQEIQAEVRNLAERDREVRSHELAHSVAGGRYSGSPSYEFKRGPDGNTYAVNGEVSIDLARAATPQATIEKMEIVRQAALAPADPSSQDRQVAAEAARIAAQARQELAAESGQNIDKSDNSAKLGSGARSLESESSPVQGSERRSDVDTVKAQRISSLYSENRSSIERGPANLLDSRA